MAQQIDTKLALFFDNEIVNFNNSIDILQNKCHNIIPILINGNLDRNDLEHCTIVEATIRSFFTQNILVDGETLENYLNIGLKWPISFDNTSGITIEQLTNLINLFSNSDLIFTNNISHIVLDFDRTFTMVEGLPVSKNINTFIQALQYIDPQPTSEELVTFMMGGITRRNLMVQLINLLQVQDKKIIILTNNKAPVSTPTLIPDFLRNLGLSEESLQNIEIISTHSYITGSYRLTKYNVMDTINLCNTFNTEINTIARTLEDNKLYIYREWKLQSSSSLNIDVSDGATAAAIPQPGGGHKKYNKNKKTKKRITLL